MPSRNPRFRTRGKGEVVNQFTRPIKRIDGFQNLIQTRIGPNYRNPTTNTLLEERIKKTKITKIKNPS